MEAAKLLGETFGRLTVQKRTGLRSGSSEWLCLCSCGNRIKVLARALMHGKATSCGCYRDELRRIHGHNTRHGKKSKEYLSWDAMTQRVTNPNHKHYHYYGGRGITICERWRNSFADFLKDMGPSGGLTLDRTDPNGNYEPGNCKWATRAEQAVNKRPRQKALKGV